ncbi:serine/threonine protein kinase [Dolichospermum heterosporum]|uniref:Serine/threonine protein kinase n=2 Tax=Dolichospermum TaxID=748770 RepID=A0ABY5LRM8_9CYAN|nr:serine/threonine-protein kinase [Dolichospermum heterosporum]UUO13940.1 serine/threonine protein kinase [Dolichospermum heterosporum TAC447]
MVWQKGYKLQGGRYVIEKVLGEGGFGITYQAQHTLLKQWVVIKTPNEILKNDSEYPNYVKRFIQEGRKLAQLSQQPHPNIVRVTELFEDSKTYCLVMDFVPGESLFNLVQKQGALPELEAVGYIKQIGEALIFVHHQGLVHRDAHPGNIMVQKNGKAVLIDFGIAGEIMPQDGYFTSHHPANIAFAPYEQMGGNRQVTIDVYTLAASLYYAVTGKRPESSLDRKLYNKPLISPNKYVVGISDSLNRAILKGMNLEAEYRPQSMREWLKLLPDFSNQVYQVSQKTQHQTIRTDKTFPVIVGTNNSQQQNKKINNIPWFWLVVMSLYYLIMGLLLAPAGKDLFLLLSWMSFCWAVIWTVYYRWTLVWVILWTLVVVPMETLIFAQMWGVKYSWIALVAFIMFWFLNILFIFTCIKEIEKYFSQWHKFLILLCTSWLGLFLGWLIYQIFPVFTRLS